MVQLNRFIIHQSIRSCFAYRDGDTRKEVVFLGSSGRGAMDALHVCTLGSVDISCGESLRFPTRKSRELFILLLLHAGRMLDREQVAEWLWPMRPHRKARGCLATALWRLRETIADSCSSPSSYLLSDRNLLGFNARTPYWFDVEVFEQQAALGLADALPCDDIRLQALEEALALYQGDFMDGCYDDWCLIEREHLQLLLLRILKRLQCHYRLSSAYEKSISYGQRLLVIDSLQEDVHRELMRCYMAAGKRPAALDQFQRCREMLQQDLEIEPMPETWSLYRQIQRSYVPGSVREADEGSQASLRASLVQFRYTLDLVESSTPPQKF
jgi:DNA-binding SARP family transcriptional activator